MIREKDGKKELVFRFGEDEEHEIAIPLPHRRNCICAQVYDTPF